MWSIDSARQYAGHGEAFVVAKNPLILSLCAKRANGSCGNGEYFTSCKIRKYEVKVESPRK